MPMFNDLVRDVRLEAVEFLRALISNPASLADHPADTLHHRRIAATTVLRLRVDEKSDFEYHWDNPAPGPGECPSEPETIAEQNTQLTIPPTGHDESLTDAPHPEPDPAAAPTDAESRNPNPEPFRSSATSPEPTPATSTDSCVHPQPPLVAQTTHAPAAPPQRSHHPVGDTPGQVQPRAP